MSWIDALRSSAGPLADAAHAFSPDLPEGRDGLRALADRIDAYCEIQEPSEAEDRAFVEGAGAALGLLLIAHAGEGGHAVRDGVHRVRLGRHGYFDPFGAVESILEADDPRRALAAAVRAAEAEARSEGPISRVLSRLEARLATREPPLAVREHFETYVRLSDETEIDLGRVVAATTDGDERDVGRSVDKLVALLDGLGETTPLDEAARRLLPRLLPPGFSRSLPDGSEQRGELAVEVRFSTLHVALLLAHEGRSRFVRRDELERWGLGFDGALEIAVANLAERSAAARFARVETEAGPIVVARSGDGLDAARLLLPGLHDVLAPELGSPFFVSVPHRDTLLAAPRKPDAVVAALRAKTTDDAGRAPHRISDAIYLVTPEGLSVDPES